MTTGVQDSQFAGDGSYRVDDTVEVDDPVEQQQEPVEQQRDSIVKPLPDEYFVRHDTNAEMRWDAMAGVGYRVPIDRFFVRNHTRTPIVDPETWRLELFGAGLRDAPTSDHAIEFGLADLLELPVHTSTVTLECAGNGRSLFAEQQDSPVEGTPWKLGGVGVARWRGARLADVLERAGVTDEAVEVMPQGLDPRVVMDGVDHGHVRRPLPIAKALDDVLLAYEMNDVPLPPDHGGPVRLVVPGWVGVSWIKWVGQIEVATRQLFSPWNTVMYRMFGPSYPEGGGDPVTREVLKSAFELPWNAELVAGRTHVVRGRSWSGDAPVTRVEVSTDEGATWCPARPIGAAEGAGWQCWEIEWHPVSPGNRVLLARASDGTGATQPDSVPFNTQGYLFGAVARHPVRVT